MRVIRKGKGDKLITPKEFEAIKIFENNEVEFIKIDFKEKGFFKKHISPVDIWIYVLEGRGLIEANNTKTDVIKGDMVYSPKGTAHKVINIGDLPLEILIIKIPKAKEDVIFVE